MAKRRTKGAVTKLEKVIKENDWENQRTKEEAEVRLNALISDLYKTWNNLKAFEKEFYNN